MKNISITLLCLLAIIPHTLFFFGTELAPRSRKRTQKVGTLRYEAAKSLSSLIHQRPARQRANRWQIPQGVWWIISRVKQLLVLNSVHSAIWDSVRVKQLLLQLDLAELCICDRRASIVVSHGASICRWQAGVECPTLFVLLWGQLLELFASTDSMVQDAADPSCERQSGDEACSAAKSLQVKQIQADLTLRRYTIFFL